MMDDLPKIWDDSVKYDPETGEILEDSTEMVVFEDEIPPLPTIAEQTAVVAASTISEENKGMLNSLIEMNAVAQTLAAIRSNESAEQRKTVISMICENFVSSRMRNNATAELLKNKLLERLLDNIENLDLDTTARIYNDLSDTSSVDAQQAMAQINGGGMGNTGGSGTTVNLNLATGEGGMVQALNVGNSHGAQPPVNNLTEISTLSKTVKGWGKIPTKKQTIIDAEYTPEK